MILRCVLMCASVRVGGGTRGFHGFHGLEVPLFLYPRRVGGRRKGVLHGRAWCLCLRTSPQQTYVQHCWRFSQALSASDSDVQDLVCKRTCPCCSQWTFQVDTLVSPKSTRVVRASGCCICMRRRCDARISMCVPRRCSAFWVLCRYFKCLRS